MQDPRLSREKFSLLYYLIKENANIPFTPEQFIDKSKVLSVPIFNRILCGLTIIKLSITSFYFLFWELSFLNIHIFIEFFLFLLCIVFIYIKELSKFKIFFFVNIIGEYITLRIFRILYIVIFIIEENNIYYNFTNFTFQINIGFIFFIFCSIIFFESHNFTSGLLYLYILNLLCFLYFFSLKNFMNVYIPLNIDIAIFVLVSVIGHKIGKKLTKSETFFKFYERVIDIVCKETKMQISYDGQIIFPNKIEPSNRKKSDRKDSLKVFNDLMDESQSEFSNEDVLSNIEGKNFDMFEIGDFEGFEVCLPKEENVI